MYSTPTASTCEAQMLQRVGGRGSAHDCKSHRAVRPYCQKQITFTEQDGTRNPFELFDLVSAPFADEEHYPTEDARMKFSVFPATTAVSEFLKASPDSIRSKLLEELNSHHTLDWKCLPFHYLPTGGTPGNGGYLGDIAAAIKLFHVNVLPGILEMDAKMRRGLAQPSEQYLSAIALLEGFRRELVDGNARQPSLFLRDRHEVWRGRELEKLGLGEADDMCDLDRLKHLVLLRLYKDTGNEQNIRRRLRTTLSALIQAHKLEIEHMPHCSFLEDNRTRFWKELVAAIPFVSLNNAEGHITSEGGFQPVSLFSPRGPESEFLRRMLGPVSLRATARPNAASAHQPTPIPTSSGYFGNPPFVPNGTPHVRRHTEKLAGRNSDYHVPSLPVELPPPETYDRYGDPIHRDPYLQPPAQFIPTGSSTPGGSVPIHYRPRRTRTEHGTPQTELPYASPHPYSAKYGQSGERYSRTTLGAHIPPPPVVPLVPGNVTIEPAGVSFALPSVQPLSSRLAQHQSNAGAGFANRGTGYSHSPAATVPPTLGSRTGLFGEEQIHGTIWEGDASSRGNSGARNFSAYGSGSTSRRSPPSTNSYYRSR
ncbi:hypothetical protein BJ508DRAFT_312871 [Ascobolus immersus RN42]|uniref:Uncharacterized protein n=1 Tax=Ascobolus immersus RN42 TaxID=1160509 RepID=A0A3N4HXL3_ASCIM|nr:hypothetical protein BJ508DRAFT_312871 [Ascobolus immersus RN42]